MEQSEAHSETHWPNSILQGVLVVLAVLAMWMIVSQFGDTIFRPRAQYAADMDQTSFTEITGVRIVLVAMTAGRGMIDIRYQ
ncbi:MAG: hypothetical protein GY803_32175, partial [Chloroflexi bacterium]|nr:hypothetical protein [Chloroflexota bacterium]